MNASARHLATLYVLADYRPEPLTGEVGKHPAGQVPTRGAGLLAGAVLVAVLLLVASVAGWV